MYLYFQRAASQASSVELTLQCLREAMVGDIETALPATSRLLSENLARNTDLIVRKEELLEGKLAGLVLRYTFEV